MSVQLHQTLAATAKRLIGQHGRSFIFRRFDQSPADNTKPWRGPTDVGTSFATEVTVSAVVVPPSSETELGQMVESPEMLRRVDQILIVPDSDEDLSLMSEVQDTDGKTYRIEFVEVLKPGSVKVLYFIGVRR